jgi:YegS/Rv2252/BmrU family lipid kinase
MYKRIHIVVNPASGQDKPMLATFNSVFQPAGVKWDVSVTNQAGDAYRFAREAMDAGVDAVGVYGGDGTVREVAAALAGSQVPMAIFPGGTANALSRALGISRDLAEACALVTEQESRVLTIDMGQVGDECFLVAIGLGIAGSIAEEADREEKDKLGILAYALKMIQSTRQAPIACYSIKIDGQQIESEGVLAVIANSGNFGIPGVTLTPTVDMTDGLLDVLVVPSASVPALVSLAASMARQDLDGAPVEHWQGRDITIVSDPPQPIQADGEVLDPGEVHVTIAPQALRVIVPKAAAADG